MFEEMGGFEELEEANREFNSRVPHGHESYLVLTAHLIAEQALVKFIKARVSGSNFEKQFTDDNSPCRSGLGLILLAQGLSLRDEIPQAHAELIWPSLRTLNSLRNRLVHELDPDANDIHKRMKKFITQACPEMLGNEPNINKAFRECANLVVLYLNIDQQPLSLSDID